MSHYELAQLNIGVIKEPLESPRMAGFVANLDRINALADQSPGTNLRTSKSCAVGGNGLSGCRRSSWFSGGFPKVIAPRSPRQRRDWTCCASTARLRRHLTSAQCRLTTHWSER